MIICDISSDLDECAIGTHRCHKFAVCTNTAGNYTCKCNKGFSGDGYSCFGKFHVLIIIRLHNLTEMWLFYNFD